MLEPKEKKAYKPLPIRGVSLSNWIRLLWDNGGIDLEYLPRALFVTLQSLRNTPLILNESIQYGKKIKEHKIQQAPVFIIGHCRSGTTYLHHLLGHDPNFGYITKAQVLVGGTEFFLGSPELVQTWADKIYPQPRLSDGLVLHSDDPAEEEIAMANGSTYSFYTGFYFPKNIKANFQRYVLFENQEKAEKEAWKTAYLRMLSRIDLTLNDKRLLVKNPLNGARIRLLLELFPDAKFINIFRDPNKVFLSTKKLYNTLIPRWGLQAVSDLDHEQAILFIYRKLMDKYFADKETIPTENLFEVKYENFIGNEVNVLEEIYQHLDLPGFIQAKPKFIKFIDSERERYKKYRMQDLRSEKKMDKLTLEKIENAWKPIIEKWKSM